MSGFGSWQAVFCPFSSQNRDEAEQPLALQGPGREPLEPAEGQAKQGEHRAMRHDRRILCRGQKSLRAPRRAAYAIGKATV